MSGLGRPTVILTMLVAVFVNASDSALFHPVQRVLVSLKALLAEKAGGKKQRRKNVQA